MSNEQANTPGQTLWTSVVNPAPSSELCEALARLTPEQLKTLVAKVASDAQSTLPGLLKPYETELSPETLARAVG